MEFILQPWQFYFLILVGWVNRQQQQQLIEYRRNAGLIHEIKISELTSQTYKSIKPFMEIKLNDIIEKLRLKLSTAQYILKHPELLPGLPVSGSQGRHRQFSIQQALRLGICCQMVMLGLPLRHAVKVMKFIEHQIRAAQPENFGKRLTYIRDSFTEPWTVELFDCRFVRVWCGVLDSQYPARRLYLDLKTGKTCKFQSEPDRLVYSEINLTEIETVLAKK